MKKSTIKKIMMSLFTLILTFIVGTTVKADSTTTLTLNNIQTDTSTAKYTYKVTIDGVVGAVKYTIDGTEGYAVFNAKSEATITIDRNSTITFYEIPLNKNYTIEQTSGRKGYKTVVNNNETTKATGVTSPTNNVSFTNSSSDDVKNPTEQKEEKNPVTADPIIIALTVLIIAAAGFIGLRKLKVRRYE